MKKQAGSPRARLDSAKRGEAGQTLLEILLALSVAILALSAIVLGVATSLSNTQYTKNQGLANSYAQEGMAVLRQIRDSSWNNFCSYGSINYCLPQNAVTLASYDSNNCFTNGIVANNFVRKVELTHNSSDCCPDNTTTCTSGTCLSGLRGSKAVVRVSWADNKCSTPYCHKVELITCFSSIDLKPTP